MLSVDGRKTRKPGVYSTIETEGTVTTGVANKRLVVVGKSDVEDDIHGKYLTFNNLRQAREILAGDLAKALEVIWNASTNPDERPGEVGVVSIGKDENDEKQFYNFTNSDLFFNQFVDVWGNGAKFEIVDKMLKENALPEGETENLGSDHIGLLEFQKTIEKERFELATEFNGGFVPEGYEGSFNEIDTLRGGISFGINYPGEINEEGEFPGFFINIGRFIEEGNDYKPGVIISKGPILEGIEAGDIMDSLSFEYSDSESDMYISSDKDYKLRLQVERDKNNELLVFNLKFWLINEDEPEGWNVSFELNYSGEDQADKDQIENDFYFGLFGLYGMADLSENTNYPYYISNLGLAIDGVAPIKTVGTEISWDNALDVLSKVDVDGVVPLTTSSTVISNFENHVIEKTNNRKERQLFISPSNTTKSSLITKAGDLSYHSVLIAPGSPKVRVSGESKVLDNYFMAAAVAGLWAGLGVGEPITFKYLNLLGIERDYSDDDIEDLIEAGVCVVEEVPNRGYRIVRGVTAAGNDDLYKKELSIVEIIKILMKQLRRDTEERFVGNKMDQFVVSSVRNYIITRLNQYEEAGWIAGLVTDEEEIPAYRNLEVYRSGVGAIVVDMDISPVEPNNFIHLRVMFGS